MAALKPRGFSSPPGSFLEWNCRIDAKLRLFPAKNRNPRLTDASFTNRVVDSSMYDAEAHRVVGGCV